MSSEEETTSPNTDNLHFAAFIIQHHMGAYRYPVPITGHTDRSETRLKPSFYLTVAIHLHACVRARQQPSPCVDERRIRLLVVQLRPRRGRARAPVRRTPPLGGGGRRRY